MPETQYEYLATAATHSQHASICHRSLPDSGIASSYSIQFASCVSLPGATPTRTARMAGRIATFPDLKALPELSHGGMVQRRYGVAGAREEACRGFPNVVRVGLPALHSARRSGSEAHARLDALVAMIACVDDTCLLYRGGPRALAEAQVGARAVQDAGGVGARAGGRALLALEERLLRSGASPGGSADLLAAVAPTSRRVAVADAPCLHRFEDRARDLVGTSATALVALQRTAPRAAL